ncbi:MAG: aminotransferase class V-fold PLP-dependent enzyme, partial [Planctomycetota bacterium]
SAAAAFLHADPEHTVFVPNATTAVNTVLASMEHPAGSALATTDHVYPAVLNTLRVLCEQRGWRLDVLHAPLPTVGTSADDAEAMLTSAVMDRLADDVRMLVLDEVASPTGLIFPVPSIVRLCRERGVMTLIDAAHSPGMLDVHLDMTRDDAPDFWTGNFHKWVFSPRGSAGLCFRPEHASRTRPLVTSLFHGRGPFDEFMWTGTFDPTAWLTVPAGIDFYERCGGGSVREHNNALVRTGQQIVQKAVQTELPIADDPSLYASLGLVEIPHEFGIREPAGTHRMMDALFETYRVEVPFTYWHDRTFVRLSAQVFNAADEYQRLADVLPEFLRTHREQWQ